MKIKLKNFEMEVTLFECVVILLVIYGLLTSDFQTVIKVISHLK